MTTKQIIENVRSKLGYYSLASFHRDRRRFKIKPLGARQKPQRYPDAAVQKILYGRGLTEFLSTMRVATAPVAGRRMNLPTVAQLRELKRRVKR